MRSKVNKPNEAAACHPEDDQPLPNILTGSRFSWDFFFMDNGVWLWNMEASSRALNLHVQCTYHIFLLCKQPAVLDCEKREVYVILYSWSEQSLTKDKFHLFLVAYILFQYGGILALHNLLSVFMNYCLVIKLVCWSTILNKRIPLSYLYYEIGWKF